MRITAGIVALICTAAALGLPHVVSARAAHRHSAHHTRTHIHTHAHRRHHAAPAQQPPPAAESDPNAQARKAFQEAYAHVPQDQPDAGAHDSKLLKSYVLYPYLEAARIRQALSTATGAAPEPVDLRAQDFLITYADLPVARALRRDWLDSLAHRQQWSEFMQVYRDTGHESIRCESFSARIALSKTDGLAQEITSAWLTPRSLPECQTAFTWLKEQGYLTPDLIEKRVRLALEDGNASFARQIIPQLPPDRAAPLMQWVELLESSEQSIDTLIANPQTPVEPEALLAGWTKYARLDPEGAKARYAQLVQARGLSKEAASPYALALALALAWNRDSDALQYFDQVAQKDMEDLAYEWWARAALWAQDWAVAAKSIAALPKSLRESARWRYWAARIAEKLGETARAQRLYRSLLTEDDYYSAMAAAHLKRPVVPHPETLPREPQILRRLSRMPGMQRAHELFLCNMRPEALAEWQDAYDSLSAPAREQAIRLASSWGWYDQAVSVAASQHIYNDYKLLYPRPYEPEVKAAAHAVHLAPEIVYGVMRQESLYRVDAVSSAGALGLMQLEPDTARRTARFTKHALPTIADLFLPSVNTTLGAARLRMLLDQFGGQISLALAGYNAGVHAVLRWLPPRKIDSDIWIENIPYNETRGYVQRVLWHSLLFTWLGRDHAAQRTTSWLAPIRPVYTDPEDHVASSPRARTTRVDRMASTTRSRSS